MKELLSFFTDKEMDKIKTEQNGLRHPILDLLNDSYDSNDNINSVRYNTVSALRLIEIENKDWFNKKRKLLLSKNRNNVSAILGEFRCYASLINTFGINNVLAIPEKKGKKTIDFQVIKDNEIISIEVNTIQMNENEAKKLIDFYNKKNSNGSVVIREIDYCPYGTKLGYGNNQNVIRKIYNVKSGYKQFGDKTPNVLWIDLQDEEMNFISDRLEKFSPIFSTPSVCGGVQGFYSNELWYALYAPKGLNIFSGETMNAGEGIKKTLSVMEYAGKFYDEKLSAVIYSGPNTIILCENPNAQIKLPVWFVNKITEMRNFKLESSIVSFMGLNIKSCIDNGVEFVKVLSKNNFYKF